LKHCLFLNDRLKNQLMLLDQLKKTKTKSMETKSRILTAAEHLFTAKGFAGVTMREVAHRAATNIASAHYHFGSKEGLVIEMLSRRIAPINAERLRLLDNAKLQSDGNPLNPIDIFKSLLLPIGQAATGAEGPDPRFMQLVGRSFTEPASFLEKVHRQLFRELSDIFMVELRRSHPEAREEDLFWNLHFVVATMLGALANHRRLAPFSGGLCAGKNVSEMIQRLIVFAAGGFASSMENIKRKNSK
jgi:AcrR family transcriptional regulator